MSFPRLVPRILIIAVLGAAQASDAAETVATAVKSRIGNGYQRTRLKDGSFMPEFYALSNGGRLAGTTSDATVDRVTYPEVAAIAMKLLAQQNYNYAWSREEAKLLLVLQWGNTIAFDRTTYDITLGAAAAALKDFAPEMRNGFGSTRGGGDIAPPAGGGSAADAKDRLDSALIQLGGLNMMRDQKNLRNARVLGYLDDINDVDDIRRYAGGGDRYTDLITDVEEARYYIVISAYDFREVTERNKKKLLWQTRVSVRSPGNRFDDSFVAMLKSASKYFGQDSGPLIRGEESKGTVELDELKFLGEEKKMAPSTPGNSEK